MTKILYGWNPYQTWNRTHSQGNHTISQPALAIYPKEVPARYLFRLPLLAAKKDPVAYWLVTAIVTDYLPNFTTEVRLLFENIVTVMTTCSARSFQAPTGSSWNTPKTFNASDGMTPPKKTYKQSDNEDRTMVSSNKETTSEFK